MSGGNREFTPMLAAAAVAARYLLDIAHQIEGDQAQFLLADAASPTIVRDLADTSALYVLMPMRV